MTPDGKKNAMIMDAGQKKDSPSFGLFNQHDGHGERTALPATQGGYMLLDIGLLSYEN